MLHCFNPACSAPENPDRASYCDSCGASLTQPYVFRDRYRIARVLGQGAFGRTYKAENLERFNDPCVIKKFIAQGQGASLRKAKELFQREAKRLNDLDHPQIPRLHAYFQQKGVLYLVQEFVEGEDLRSEFGWRGRYSEAEIRELLESLLPVLQYLHSQDPPLIHRDIKPENIMRRQGDRQLVLIDFGGAKQIAGTSLSRPGTVIYTPGYAAFEQINGQPRPASDLYSLGATCARLLTGCFPRKTARGTQDELYDADRGCWLWQDYLQRHGIAIGEELGTVLEGLLQHFARNRYQSAREVLAALRGQSIPTGKTAMPSPTTLQPSSLHLATTRPATPFHRITRAKFLKFAGFAGLGVVSTAIVGSLLSRRERAIDSRQPQIDFNSFPERPDSAYDFRFEVVTVNNKGEVINQQSHRAKSLREDLGNGVNLELVAIPGGTFIMGSPDTEENRSDDEGPQHPVTVSPFFMSKYAITQEQWQAVAKLPKIARNLAPNPSRFKGEKHPVEMVSWYDAVEFCDRVSRYLGRQYRLPSEAEWEYACRAGTTTPFYFGEAIATNLANYNGNYAYASAPKGKYREQTTKTGRFPPNLFGLYEMHGNVWEWCADPWHDNYEDAPTDGSIWLGNNDNRYYSLRGGSWFIHPRYCRSAVRNWCNPVVRYNSFGFRVVGVAARMR